MQAGQKVSCGLLFIVISAHVILHIHHKAIGD